MYRQKCDQREAELRSLNPLLIFDGSPPSTLPRSGNMFLNVDKLTTHIDELDHWASRGVTGAQSLDLRRVVFVSANNFRVKFRVLGSLNVLFGRLTSMLEDTWHDGVLGCS